MDMDKYLDRVDKKGTTGNWAKERQAMPSKSVPRPRFGKIWTAPPRPDTQPPSKGTFGLPAGFDIGAETQHEAEKVFKGKLSGRFIANPLHYRKPATAIDEKFGPGDRVC